MRNFAGILLGSLFIIAMINTGCRSKLPPTQPAAQPTAPANKTEPAPETKASPGDTAGKFAEGKTLFDSNCTRCHSTGGGAGGPGGGPGGGGPGGRGKGGGMRGPDLSKVATNHTKAWLMDHIRDPKTHKAESRMPKFEGKLQDKEIGAIADYLGSLKG